MLLAAAMVLAIECVAIRLVQLAAKVGQASLENAETADHPLVSVVMPVYNAAEFVEEAVASIQNQSYSWWELLCVDDESTDRSAEVLQSLAAQDPRIRVIRRPEHGGVASACNAGLLQARGELIARMDADDVASPDRLERQVLYLLGHPSAVAVGGQVVMVDRFRHVISQKRFPTEPEAIRRMMFSCMPVQQGAMLVHRGRLPRDFAWYQPGATTAEEVELLFRFLEHGELANLEETVLKYRLHGNNVSLRQPKKTFILTLRARLKAVFAYGYRPTLTGLLVTYCQTVAVLLLPGRWVYPVFALVRGIRPCRTLQTAKGGRASPRALTLSAGQESQGSRGRSPSLAGSLKGQP
jgi:glycosyltransferase involved in cell wall biosynthesis